MVVYELVTKIVSLLSKYIVGYDENLLFIVLTAIARGHVLLYGPPGSAKTLTAKLFAQLLGLKFSRIQFAPDILPSDIIGTKVIDPRTGELRTVLGPIYANIVLADEINRANPKSLSALIEAMQEKQITIEGDVYKLPVPFMVIATLNPIEVHGIYPLPIAILDRFTISLVFDYMDIDREIEIVLRDLEHDYENLSIEPIVSSEHLLKAYEELRNVSVDKDIVEYSVKIVQSIRNHRDVAFGPSPRASIHIVKIARALALAQRRNYVIPDDIKKCSKYVLRHRVVLKENPSNLLRSFRKSEEIISEVLHEIEPPW